MHKFTGSSARFVVIVVVGLAFGLGGVGATFAQSDAMKKDGQMMKDDTMKMEEMKKDDAMKQGEMKRGDMMEKGDMMKKDEKKGEMMEKKP